MRRPDPRPALLAVVGRDADLDGLLPDLAARGFHPVHRPPDDCAAPLAGVLAADAPPGAIRRWRAGGLRCPILCLARAEPAVAAEQLDAGADALLVPPLSADGVALSLAVAARRTPDRLRLDDRLVDLDTGTVQGPGGSAGLTPTEARLLAELHAAGGRPVPRAALLRRVWGFAPGVRSRALDNAVRRLRTKLEPDPDAPRYVLTVHRVGYRLRAPSAARPPPARDPRRADDPVPCVGRGPDRAAVEAALTAHGACWIWGPAGVGKTRLAAEVADARSEARWLSDVVGQGGDHLAVRIAAALDVGLPLGARLADLGPLLAPRGPTLLVFDALPDPLAGALLDALPRWRQTAPRCHVLVTARRRAGIAGAHRLAPLDPAAARRLIRAAAERHRPLPPEADPALDRLVARLDGLPQTLLLVAARLRYGRAAALVHDLPPADALADALDRTWRRLDRWRRALLTAATLFVGDFDLADLDAIGPVPDPAAPDTAALVDDLVAAGLLEPIGAPPRLRLLPATRAAVRARSAPGLGLVERYARHRIGRAERLVDRLVGDDAAAAIGALVAELPALEALVAHPPGLDPDLRSRAALAIGCCLGQRRVLPGHAERLAAIRRLDPPPDRAIAHRLALQQARFERLTGRFDAAAATLRGLEAPPGLGGRDGLERVWIHLRAGRLDDAEAAIERGLAAALADGDRLSEGELLDRAATVARRRGQLDRAASLGARSIDALREAGAVWPELIAVGNAALLHLARGERDRAEATWRALAERAAGVARWGVEVGARINLGAALLARGRHGEAEVHLEAAFARATAGGLRAERALSRYHLGRLRLDRGDPEPAAHAALSEARALAATLGEERVAAAASLWRALADHLAGRRSAADAGYRQCGPDLARLAPALVPLWAFARRRLDPQAGPIPEGPDPAIRAALQARDAGRAHPDEAPLAARSIELRVALRLVR